MRKSLAQRLLIALFGLAAFHTNSAWAEVPADGVDSLNQAATAFVGLLEEPEYKTAAPRAVDLKVKPVFAALLDRQKILGSEPYTEKDIQPLLAIFSGYFTLSKVYIEHRDESGKQPEVGNETAYQDELALLAKGMIETGGSLSLALTALANSKPAGDFSEQEKAQLAKYRLGISQVFSSAVSLVQNPQYSEANKALLAASLAENGKAFRDIILVAERGNIANAAMQALMYAPKNIEADMNAFLEDLRSEECTGLCALK